MNVCYDFKPGETRLNMLGIVSQVAIYTVRLSN